MTAVWLSHQPNDVRFSENLYARVEVVAIIRFLPDTNLWEITKIIPGCPLCFAHKIKSPWFWFIALSCTSLHKQGYNLFTQQCSHWVQRLTTFFYTPTTYPFTNVKIIIANGLCLREKKYRIMKIVIKILNPLEINFLLAWTKRTT